MSIWVTSASKGVKAVLMRGSCRGLYGLCNDGVKPTANAARRRA